MEYYQIDPASGATMIGGDMLEWSDLGGARAPRAARELLRSVLGDPSRSVTLVGPTASLLLDELNRSTPVNVLVRGVPDARDLQTRSGLHRDLTVYCGGLDRFSAPEPADVVVALDARDQLLTPDSPPTTQEEVIAALVALARPGGIVAISVRNPLGLDVLAPPVEQEPAGTWMRAGAGFDQWAHYPQVPGLFARAGLDVGRVYGAYPSAADTSVLLAADADDATVSRADLFVQAQAGDHFARRPATTDPMSLLPGVFAAGMQASLAPAWLVVGSRGDGPKPAWPDLVVAENTGSPRWDLSLSATADGVSATPALEVTERRVARDVGRLAAGAAAGRTLEIALRSRLADHDVTGARELVSAYTAWLTSVCPVEHRMFAAPDNVVLTPTGALESRDPSWAWSGPTEDRVALARGLRRFAGRLVSAGAPHPWSPNASPDHIAQTLLPSSVGEWDESLPDLLARIEGEIAATVQGMSTAAEQQAVTADAERGRNELVALPGLAMGYRQALRKVAELAQELRTRDQRIDWLERHLEWRDRQYAMLEKRTNAVQATVGYRAANALAAPKNKAVSVARQTVMSQLPPGFKEKAEKAARRMLNNK